MPKFPSLKGSAGVKSPSDGTEIDADLSLRGTGDVDANLPNSSLDIDAPDVDIDVKGPDVAVDLPELKTEGDVEVVGPSGDVDLDASGERLDTDLKVKKPKKKRSFNFKMPKFGGKVKEPKTAVNINVDAPDTNVEVKLPEVDAPDVVGEGDMDVELPSAEIDVKAPAVDVSTDVDVESPTGKGKGGFGFKMPKFPSLKGSAGVKSPSDGAEIDADLSVKGKAGADSEAPDADLNSDIPAMTEVDLDAVVKANVGDLEAEVPSADVDLGVNADADVKGPKVKGKGFGFKMPKFPSLKGSAGVKSPSDGTEIDADLSLRGIDVDANLPNASLEVDASDVDIDVKGPDVAVDLPVLKTEGDVELEGPSGDLDLDASVGGLDTDLTVKKPKKKRSFNFKMPRFGGKAKGPKAEMVIDVAAPDSDAKLPSANVDVNAEAALDDGVDIDVEVPNEKVEGGFGIKTPKFPNLKGSAGVKSPSTGAELDADLSLKGKGKVDIDSPRVDASMKNPDAVVSVEVPDTDMLVESPAGDVKGKKKGFGFKMPDFHFGGKGKAKSPKLDVDGEAEVPVADIDVPIIANEAPDGKVDRDVDVELPTESVDAQAPLGDLNSEESAGNIGFDGPDTDDHVKDKKKAFGFSLPTFGGKIKGPKLDAAVDVKETNIGGDVDRDLPDAGVETDFPDLKAEGDVEVQLPSADIDVPSAEADVKAPVVDLDTSIERPSASFNVQEPKKRTTFGVKMPKFGGKAKGPILDADVDVPEVHVDAKPADVKVDGDVDVEAAAAGASSGEIETNAPSTDLDVESPKGHLDVKGPKVKGKGFSLKMPKFTSLKGKAKSPEAEVDVDAKGDLEALPSPADVDLKAEREIQAPSAAIEIPEGDLEIDAKGKVKAKGKKPKIKAPSFKSKAATPKIDKPKKPGTDIGCFGIGGGKGRGSIDDDEVGLDADVSVVPAAEFDLDVEASDGEVDGGFPKKKAKFPVSGAIEVNNPSAGTELDANLTVSGVSGELPKGEAKVDADAPEIDLNVKPEGDLDVKGPSGDVDGKAEADINVNAADVELPDVKGKKKGFHIPSIKFPSLKGRGKADLPKAEAGLKIEEPEIVVAAPVALSESASPALDLQGGDAELDINVDGKGDLDVQLPVADLPGPSVDADVTAHDVTAPDVDLSASGEGPNASIDIQEPNKRSSFGMKMPKFGIHMPKFGGKGKEPKLDADADVPEVEVKAKIPDVDAELPDVNAEGGVRIEQPSGDAQVDLSASGEGPDASIDIQEPNKRSSFGIKMPKFHRPKFGGKGKELKLETDVDVDAKVTDADMDVGVPGVEAGTDLDVNLTLPDAELDVGGDAEVDMDVIPSTDVDMKLPEPDINVKPATDVELPDADLEVKKKKKGFHIPNIKFPSLKGHGKAKTDLPKADGELDVQEPEIIVAAPAASVESAPPALDVQGADVLVSSPELVASVSPSARKPKSKSGFKFPKLEGTIDLLAPGGHVGLDADLSPSSSRSGTLKKVKGDGVAGLNVTAEGPSADVDVKSGLPDVQVTGGSTDVDADAGLNMPSLKSKGKTNAQSPDADVRTPTAGVDAEAVADTGLDVSATADIPSADLSADFKGPKSRSRSSSTSSSSSRDDDEKKEKKKKKKGFGFGFGGKLPSAGVAVKAPSADMDVGGGVGLKGPKIELEKNKSTGELGFGVGFGFGAGADALSPSGQAKTDIPSADVNMEAPSLDVGVNGDVDTQIASIEAAPGDVKTDFEMPSVNGELNPEAMAGAGASVDVDAPKTEDDIEGPSVAPPKVSSTFKERLEQSTPDLLTLAADSELAVEDSDDEEMEPLTHKKVPRNDDALQERQRAFSAALNACTADLRGLIDDTSDNEAAVKLSADAAADAEPAVESGENAAGGLSGGLALGGSAGLSAGLSGGINNNDSGGGDISAQTEGSGSISNSASLRFKPPSLF